jgi:signal transduction histidine kinase
VPVFGIRSQLAVGLACVFALFGVSLGVHAWAGKRRDAGLITLRLANQRRAAAAELEHDLDDRWREVSVLQHVTLTDAQAQALTERLASLRRQVARVSASASPDELRLASEFLAEYEPLELAWTDLYRSRVSATTGGGSSPTTTGVPGAPMADEPEASNHVEPASPEPARERLRSLRDRVEQQVSGAVSDLASVSAVTDRVAAVTFVVSIAIVALSSLVLWRRLSGGLGHLADGAARVGGGELSHRIDLRRRDELGDLATAFNRMAASLEHSLGEADEARCLAEQASRAKSTFLAGITHDLRTPLTAILGYAGFIREEAGERGLESVVADAEHIEGTGRHMLGLVNDLLDLARAESGRMTLTLEIFDVAAVVEDVVATLGVLIGERGNRLDVHVPDAAGEMTADPMKLRQVLFNLLGNAAKFTSDGVISLGVERVSTGDAERVRFSVSDTGVGIPADSLDKIFDEFEQGDPSVPRTYGGTGLGLAITRRFCRLMGGDVTVTSEPAQGTTFVVDLPAQVREAGDDAAPVTLELADEAAGFAA